ncbi:hypothetical protein [Streptomonospora salina]|uniref:Uncharacterized protein n=2 Tax=Streptomonospora salina TaxID=104205 RepID=A0A841EFS1_9ACTN|nr:hypothetical protein [Streptomonospora salina]MBB5998261.1 hypothetical protein [Streptomonospora salina]
MSAGTTHGGRTAPSDTLRPTAPRPGRPAPPDDSAELDEAQNAALASLIRRLAHSRPEIVAGRPPVGPPPQSCESPPRAPEPRSGAPGPHAPTRPEPEPGAPRPHGGGRADTAPPDGGDRPAEAPAPPAPRRRSSAGRSAGRSGGRADAGSRARIGARAFREFAAVACAAALAAGTAAALVRVLPVLAA